MKQNFKKGFTLIELLVVIAIIGILAAITVVSVSGPRNKATDTQTLANLRQAASSMEQYYSDNNSYPVASTWATIVSSLSANYGTIMNETSVVTGNVYDASSTASAYCLFADSKAASGNKILCVTGASCQSTTTAAAAVLGCS